MSEQEQQLKQEQEAEQQKQKLDFIQQVLEKEKGFRVLNKQGGKGSFGVVLFVEDGHDSSKKYAIKAQPITHEKSGQLDEAKLYECKQEADIMRKCKFKNVVQIHSDFVIGSYHFIQMNLCKQSLSNYIEENKKPIDDFLFFHYATQILDGIDYLHNQNYVMRDLSTNNILITTEGIIQLCDFGLVQKIEDSLTQSKLLTDHLKGAFLYQPPEIREDMENEIPFIQTKQGDIWAYGVCLSLFGGLDSNYYVFQIAYNNYIPKDSPYLSQKANQMIKYILNKDPASRPSIIQIRERLYNQFVINANNHNQNQNNNNNNNNSNNNNNGKNGNQQIFMSDYNKQPQNNNLLKISFPSSVSYGTDQKIMKDSLLNSLFSKTESQSSNGQQNASFINNSIIDSTYQLQNLSINNPNQGIFNNNLFQGQRPQSETYNNQSLGQPQLIYSNSVNHNKVHSSQQVNEYLNNDILIDRVIDYNFKESDRLHKQYKDYLNKYPNNIDVLISLGFIESKSFSNHSLAEKYFQLASKINDTDVDIYLGFCQVHLGRSQLKDIKQGQLYIQKCINLRSSYWRIYYYRFLLSMKENSVNFDHLEQSIQKLKNLDAHSFVIQTLQTALMVSQQQQNEVLDKNIAYLTENNKQHDIFVYDILIQYHWMKQNMKLAEENSMKLLSFSKNNMVALQNLVLIYWLTSQEKLRDECVELLKTHYSDNSLTWGTMAIIAASDEAKYNLLMKAKQLDPSNELFLIQLGDIKFQQKKYDEASVEYQKAYDLNKDSENANLKIAYLQLELQNYQESLIYFKQAISKNPKNYETWYQLANINYIVSDFTQAKQCASRCSQVNPELRKVYLLQSQIEKKLKNEELAAQYHNVYLVMLKKGVEKKSYDDCITLGKYYEGQGQLDQAKQCYFQAIEINDNLYEAHYQLATLLCKQDILNPEILAQIAKAIQIHPTLEAYLLQAEHQQKTKQYHESINSLNQALVKFGKNDLVYYKLAFYYFDINYYNECRKNIEESLKLQPLNREYLILAAQTLEQLIRRYPNDPFTEANELRLSEIYLDLKEKVGAQGILEQILVKNPKCTRALEKLAQLSQEFEPEKALKLYQSLLEHVQTPEIYTNLGNVYRKVNNQDQAKYSYLQGLKLDQNYQPAYYRLGLLYKNIDKIIAVKLFIKAAELDQSDLFSLLEQAMVYSTLDYQLSAREFAMKVLNINPNFEHSNICQQIVTQTYDKVGKGKWDHPTEIVESDFQSKKNEQQCTIF